MYEKYFTDYQEAKKFKKSVNGKISSFLSTDEHENIITIWKVTYKQLF